MSLLNMLGNGRRGGGVSPMTLALLGLLAYRTVKGKGRLADMIGMGKANGAEAGTSRGAGGLGGLGAGLGGLLAGGGLASGVQDLLDRFRQTGHEKTAQSWVSTGPNQSVAPQELEKALGEERVQWLVEQTGLSKEQLLAGLSTELPGAIDELTPDGRLPTDEELVRKAEAV